MTLSAPQEALLKKAAAGKRGTARVSGNSVRTALTYEDDNMDSAEVSTQSGTRIGRVYKSSYYYEQRLRGLRYSLGGRSVPCWAMDEGPLSGSFSLGFGPDRYTHSHYRTRRAALEDLVREHLERGEEEKKVIEFRQLHPEARFRIKDSQRRIRIGTVVNLHAGGLTLRDFTGKGDVKIRRQAIREDRSATILEVQLGRNRRWQAVANAMYEEH